MMGKVSETMFSFCAKKWYREALVLCIAKNQYVTWLCGEIGTHYDTMTHLEEITERYPLLRKKLMPEINGMRNYLETLFSDEGEDY